jgi:transposase-like protein
MINKCPYCESEKFVKRGLSKGKQRFRCSSCKRSFSEGAHEQKKKDFALYLYLNNSGIRVISRVLNIAPSLVLRWIRKAHSNLEDIFKRRVLCKEEAAIIEMDEIYTYVKKNCKEQSYGLLIVEGKSVLLRLK